MIGNSRMIGSNTAKNLIYFCLLISKLLYCQGASPEHYSLNKCLQFSLQNNLKIQISQERVRTAEYDLDLNKTKKYPRMSITTYSGISQFNGGLPLPNIIFETDNIKESPFFHNEFGIHTSWLLFDNGRITLENQQKQNKLLLSEINLKATQNEILFETAVAYCKTYHVKQKLLLMLKTLNTLKHIKQKVYHYNKSGFLSNQNFTEIERQIFDFEALLNETEYDFIENKMILTSIVRMPKGGEFTIDSLKCFDKSCFLRLLHLQDSLNQNNYSIQKAKLILKDRNLYLQRANKHNGITLHLNTFFRYSTQYSWNIGMGLNWPIFDFGEKTALKNIAEKSYIISELEVEAVEKEILIKTRLSYERMRLNYQRLIKLNNQQPVNEEISNIIEDNVSIQPIGVYLQVIQQKLENATLAMKKYDQEQKFHLSCFDYLKSINRMELILNNGN